MVTKKQYAVVVCPNCEFVRVVDQTNKTSECGRCGKRRKMKKLRKFVETDSQEKARLVAAEVRAKQSNMEDDFFEAYESGELDMSNYSGIDGVADWITESSNETDSRSSKEIVIDGINECDEATVENIVAYAESNGVSEEKVMTLLNQMRRHGDVLQKQSGEFRYL